jgi:modulator of FtsH protease
MSRYTIDAWQTFAGAQATAAAALAGLVFVGVSINLKAIIASRHLVNRAGEALVHLVAVLLASTLVLVPAQGRRALGIEFLILGVIVLASVLFLQRPVSEGAEPWPERVPRASVPLRAGIGGFGAAAPIIAGLSLIAGSGGGLDWWVAGIIASYVAALLGAWVLLVEIMR